MTTCGTPAGFGHIQHRCVAGESMQYQYSFRVTSKWAMREAHYHRGTLIGRRTVPS